MSHFKPISIAIRINQAANMQAISPPPTEQDWLSTEQQGALRERSNLMGLYLVAHAWALIFLAMALFALWPNPLSFLVALIVIGGRQLGLAILMHDAAHRLLFRNAALNDWTGAWLCGAPVGAKLGAYRPYHLSHHRYTQTEKDPDLALSAPFPISRQSFWRKVRRDILGVTGYQRRKEQLRVAMGSQGTPSTRLRRLLLEEKEFLLFNAALWGLLALIGYWWLYPTLWLLPLLTWYQLISRIRNIAEHAVVTDNMDPLRNTRTTLTNRWMRLVLAPYWVNYHLEHHLLVFTPCWKLPTAHRMLRNKGLGARMELTQGYREVIRKATSNALDRTGRGKGRRAGAPAQI